MHQPSYCNYNDQCKNQFLCVFRISEIFSIMERSLQGSFQGQKLKFLPLLYCMFNSDHPRSRPSSSEIVRGKVLTVIPCNPWKDQHNGPIQVGFLSSVSRWDAQNWDNLVQNDSRMKVYLHRLFVLMSVICISETFFFLFFRF